MRAPARPPAATGRSSGSSVGRAHAAAAIAAALDALITIDHRGRVLEFNNAAEDIFGYSREKATKLILRSMGMSSDTTSEGSLSEDELIGILAASASRSPGGKSRADLFERVARFANRTARRRNDTSSRRRGSASA